MNDWILLFIFCSKLINSLLYFDIDINNYINIETYNIQPYERQALYDLYNSTNGNFWTYQEGNKGHWNFTDPNVNPCLSYNKWQGLNCTISISGLFISEIILPNYNLDGTLPISLGNLLQLIRLDLSYNSLSGTLPNSIYQLSFLTFLNLECNYNLQGTLSNLIGKLSQLEYLNLRYNIFEGAIPDTIGTLSALVFLRLTSNRFSHSIPNSIRKLKSLQLLSFSINELSGIVPHWIDELPSIRLFALYDNRLNGTIPSTYSFPSTSQLLVLVLGKNQLTGIIPNCVGELPLLEILVLDNNQLTGSIPSIVSNITSLFYLRLSDNLLTGNIINIFNNQVDLAYLELYNNYLTGSLPSTLSYLLSLQTCFLQNNHFMGNLNGVFNGRYQTQLNSIQLSNNQFTGNLPEEIFLSNILISFSAVKNCLYGSIPSSICTNNQLETLALDGLVCASSCRNKIIPSISNAYISDNEIPGGIPNCLWTMPNLQVLHLSGNGLTGSLPDNINISTSLKDLSLSYNMITGSIPSNIQEREWYNLDLSHNRISGILRSNYTRQSVNASLSLKNNRLSGTIPSHLQSMRDISILKGNAYDCKYDRSDLPTHDAYKDTYECGSDSFDVLYYIWLGLLFFITSFSLLAWYCRGRLDKCFNILSIKTKLMNWINIIEYISCTSKEIESRVTYFKQYYSIHEIILRFSSYCTMFILILLIPTYAIISNQYATHTYEYAWTVSILYLSGKIASGVIMAILIVFIISQIYLFQYSIRHSSYNELYNKKQYVIDKLAYKMSSRWKIYIMYITFISINLIIVGCVNVGYLYVVFNQSNTIVIISQILLSIFKITWNKIISPLILRRIFNYISVLNGINQAAQGKLFILQFVVSILNNIVIPCFIVAIVSPNCFYNVFQQESDVTSIFNFKRCNSVDLNLQCIDITTLKFSTSYSPPFAYSYQCSSEFVTYYAFVILLICIITTFIIPFGQIVVLQLSTWYEWKYISCIRFHELWNPINNSTKIYSSSLLSMDDIYEILVSLLTMIGLLVTFGTVFPPLSVALLIAIYRRIYFHKAILGRYISFAIECKNYSCLDIINEDCKVIPLLSTIQLCGWILLYVSCMFYTLFVFDILGDDVGIQKAYWVLIVIPCIPLCMHMIYKLYKYWLDYKEQKPNKQISDDITVTSDTRIFNKSIDGIELTSNPLYSNNDNNNDNNSINNNEDNNNIISNILDDIYVEDREGSSIMITDSSKYEYMNKL